MYSKSKIIFFLIILISSLLFSQTDNKKEASKLFFYDNQFGVFVKGGNRVAVTNNGGQNWQEVFVDTDENLQKVLFHNKFEGWLIGDSTIYKSNDGGLTWVANHTFSDIYRIHTLYFLNNKNGYIGSQSSELSIDSQINFTNDYGQNWNTTEIDSAWGDPINDFSFINDSVGVALSSSFIYKTIDAGKQWAKLPYERLTGSGNMISCTMLDESNILLAAWYPHVVAEGELLHSTDGGFTWSGFGNGQDFTWGIRDLFVQNRDSIWLTTGFKTFYTVNGGFYWDALDIRLTDFSFIDANEAFGLTGKYILHTNDGWKNYTIVDSLITEVKENIELPQTFSLSQNYPNPFNPSTTIKFSTPPSPYQGEGSRVRLVVYDMLGREIQTLLNKPMQPGSYEVEFDGSDLTSGVYFYVLETGGNRLSKKMLLVK